MTWPPLPDPGDAFEPLEGSDGALKNAATTFGHVATDLGKDVASAKKAVATATSNWRGKRSQEFRQGVVGPQLLTAEAEAAVKEVGTLVGQLGTAHHKADTDVTDAKGKYDHLAREQAAKPDPPDPIEVIMVRAKAQGFIDDARDAKTTYKTTAGQIAGEIDAQTNRLVPGGSSMSPEAIARKVGAITGVEGVNAKNPSAADAWKILKAGAAHAKSIEDLTDPDNTGEKSGGPYSGLPTDPTVLAAMRDALIASGAKGAQLRAVVAQYWTAHAAQSAGIDLDQWDPNQDAKGNQHNILAVYKYYGELYKKNPDMKWAGLANIVGPIFAAGFDDLGMIHELSDKLRDLPGPIKDGLPPDIRKIIEAGGDLSSQEAKYFEDKFLAMQKHIFMDLGSQHEAYATGGIQAVRQMYAAGAITQPMMAGWNGIHSGKPSAIDAAAGTFADREQNVVIAGQYDDMYHHDGALGAAMTYMMTTVGATAVPGSHTPAEFSHIGIHENQKHGWGPFSEESHLNVDTPLPTFNIANREDRWKYIQGDILPNYLAMTPDQVRAQIDTPVEQRIADQRLSHRWPGIVEHVAGDWHVDAGASGNVFGVPVVGVPDVPLVP